jgi:hypothetical protein
VTQTGDAELATTAEHRRLAQMAAGKADWQRWGTYVSDRAWGTVREDYSADGNAWDCFPHDHARSRAYRWNEDGLAGFCDRDQHVCLAVALWNERDPILKERMFGLSNGEGNHGELLTNAGTRAVDPDYEILGRPSVSLDDIKTLRQRGSRCAGHRRQERGRTPPGHRGHRAALELARGVARGSRRHIRARLSPNHGGAVLAFVLALTYLVVIARTYSGKVRAFEYNVYGSGHAVASPASHNGA